MCLQDIMSNSPQSRYNRKMTEKKLLDIKKIALSFLYIPFLQKQELVCKLLNKISIERNIFHIKPDKVHK